MGSTVQPWFLRWCEKRISLFHPQYRTDRKTSRPSDSRAEAPVLEGDDVAGARAGGQTPPEA